MPYSSNAVIFILFLTPPLQTIKSLLKSKYLIILLKLQLLLRFLRKFYIKDWVKFSVVIPTFNEERNIKNTLEDVFKYLRSTSWETEVLVVDDGSGDETPKIVLNLRQTFSDLKLIREK